jgi:hypothetical protein
VIIALSNSSLPRCWRKLAVPSKFSLSIFASIGSSFSIFIKRPLTPAFILFIFFRVPDFAFFALFKAQSLVLLIPFKAQLTNFFIMFI